MHDKHHEEDVKEFVEDDYDDKKRGPWKYFLALFLIIILVLMVFPYYSVKLDPNPKNIPTLKEVSEILPEIKINHTIVEREDFPALSRPDPNIKLVADWIVSQSCKQGKICQAKALFYFVRDEFEYVSDPVMFEYVKSPAESLKSGGMDCEDGAILLASLMESVGIKTRFVFIPGHAYLDVWLPEALNRYKHDYDWVSLDVTCNNCEFGEIPYASTKQQKSYVP